MTAYAVGYFEEVEMGPEIAAYLEDIDATLAPFDGRFLIHGGDKAVLEGEWPGDLVVIAFPDMKAARAWYESPTYARLLPLRLNKAKGAVILIEGVGEGHRATDILAG
ncbi:MAG: DUF1330 domain-containing protein [Oceanibaculum nanhaiense]|jgi:uncharacterized protein (DUF1330 family)|uniref:DUF1330 domain-containing protein n=1 Tax=Oceanibaculum nanhaiense TaxID=1909734 RepID=UPI0032EE8499